MFLNRLHNSLRLKLLSFHNYDIVNRSVKFPDTYYWPNRLYLRISLRSKALIFIPYLNFMPKVNGQ